MNANVISRIQAIKRSTPIEGVLAAHGVALQRNSGGSRLVGHCPFPGHPDMHPSFHVYPNTRSFFCFVCRRGGDVIDMVQLLENLSFFEALAFLEGEPVTSARPTARAIPRSRQARHKLVPAWEEIQAMALACPPNNALTAASAIYHAHLLQTPELLYELHRGGITLGMVRECHLGYADPSVSAVTSYMQAQPELWHEAVEKGLVTVWGADFFQGRVIFPEIHRGGCAWMIGRVTDVARDKRHGPNFLGLGSSKPLLGFGRALEMLKRVPRPRIDALLIEEGARDWVLSVGWRLPVLPVALLGTYASPIQLAQIRYLQHVGGGLPVWLCLDWDAAGAQGSADLQEQLWDLPIREVPSIGNASDIGDLGKQPTGQNQMVSALDKLCEDMKYSRGASNVRSAS